MSAFNFNDFMLFANVKEIDQQTYATIAAGVLDLIASQYGIYTATTTIKKLVYLQSATAVFALEYGPLQEIDDITFNGDSLDYTTFEFSEVIALSAAVSSNRIPLYVTAVVGFDGTLLVLPQDLKLAIYRHIESTFLAIRNNTDTLEKVINATGNTMYYNAAAIPDAIKIVYNYYTYKIPAEFRDEAITEAYRQD